MKARCIQAVSAAIGRPLKAPESRLIEQRIRDAMKREAARDPIAWQALSAADRLRAGATVAAKEITDEARLKQQRVALQVQAWDRIEAYTQDQVARGHDPNRLSALRRTLAPTNDGKNNITSVESSAKGIAADAMGSLTDAWEAISPKFLGLLANKDAERAFILEAHGSPTGNAMMARAVQAWADTVERLRLRYNAAGGDIGTLVNWGMPHAWSQVRAFKAGVQQFSDDMMRWVDRSRYAHEDGRPYSDAEMRDFLGEAWRTVTTDGANKLPASPVQGGRVKANRHGEHRQIHFKDGQSALEAFEAYSDRNLFETLAGHVHRMSRDIALIEQFGPNADHSFIAMLQKAYSEAAQPGEVSAANAKLYEVGRLYNYLAGNGTPPLENWLATGLNAFRSLISMAKLGSAPITAIGDNGTMYLTAHVNRIPKLKLFLNQLRAMDPTNRQEQRLAMRAGLMVHTMHNDVLRMAGDAMGPGGWTKASGTFMRASGLHAFTEASRRAFSVTMMDTLGSLTRRIANVADLDPKDMRFLTSKGIDQSTWDIWRAAQTEDWRGTGRDHVLTPESIYQASGNWTPLERQKAATKLLAVVLEEQDIAVIEPGARERAWTLDARRGTVGGEIFRSLALFKSFPHAMIARHIERGWKAHPTNVGKFAYLGSLVALSTLFGAIAMEVNDVASGRDPRTLNPLADTGPRNLLAALLKGGALGIYGDFLFSETSYGRSLPEILAGPVVSTVGEIDSATRGNVMEYLAGEETHAGAELVKAAKGITPGANLWYAKAALDHLIFQRMQEHYSPGYLARTTAKAQREAGTTWWWAPGQPLRRADTPEIEKIASAK